MAWPDETVTIRPFVVVKKKVGENTPRTFVPYRPTPYSEEDLEEAYAEGYASGVADGGGGGEPTVPTTGQLWPRGDF